MRIQRAIEQDAGVVAGEGSARRVRAVQPRREADDQQTRRLAPERRDRSAVIAG